MRRILILTLALLLHTTCVKASESIEVIDSSLVIEYNNNFRFIKGRVRNNDTEYVDYVQLVYELQDANGNTIGFTCSNVDALYPKQIKEFRANIYNNEVVKYKLVKINSKKIK